MAVAAIARVFLLLALGCPPQDARAASPRARPAAAPDSFLVALTTNRGRVVLIVHRAWAPRGADRFYELVRSGFFDDARFFRVVRGFVAQFGLPGDPRLGRAWSSRLIPDDSGRRSNRRGTVAFASAGPNTRSTQLFINLADNPRLDRLGGYGFPPIGTVVEGLAIVDALNGEYGEAPSQDSIGQLGNSYLKRAYPKLDYIRTARIAREWR
jgi:peptidyl-prolyl cis-trans isomerase A (cyclophilin A)